MVELYQYLVPAGAAVTDVDDTHTHTQREREREAKYSWRLELYSCL